MILEDIEVQTAMILKCAHYVLNFVQTSRILRILSCFVDFQCEKGKNGWNLRQIKIDVPTQIL